jgi:hypothetical protein
LCWALTTVANPDFDATGDTKRKKRALDGGNFEMPFLLKEKKRVNRGRPCPVFSLAPSVAHEQEEKGKKIDADHKGPPTQKKGEPAPRVFFLGFSFFL